MGTEEEGRGGKKVDNAEDPPVGETTVWMRAMSPEREEKRWRWSRKRKDTRRKGTGT